MMFYSERFKESVVRKVLSPGGPSINSMTQELGLGHTTISRWITQLGNVEGMSKRKLKEGRANDKPPAEKLRLVNEASGLSEEALGEFLRRNGIHSAQLEQWRKDALDGLSAQPRKSSGRNSLEAKRIRELERELRRKDKALAETAALLVLKKKVQEIWGDADDDTMPKSGE